MFNRTNKLNEMRLWAMILMLVGMLVMILGTAGIVFWGQAGKIFAGIFLAIGCVGLLGSVGIYFYAGMMSTSVKSIVCPECGKETKMLGKTDRCMHCKTILTLDPALAQTDEATVATNCDQTEAVTKNV
jgi:hypothetical protein